MNITDKNIEIALMFGMREVDNELLVKTSNLKNHCRCFYYPTSNNPPFVLTQERIDEGNFDITHYAFTEYNLCYHSDWNWINEIIDFIENLGHDTEIITNTRDKDTPYEFNIDELGGVKPRWLETSGKDKKQVVFEGLYKFAKKYNSTR